MSRGLTTLPFPIMSMNSVKKSTHVQIYILRKLSSIKYDDNVPTSKKKRKRLFTVPVNKPYKVVWPSGLGRVYLVFANYDLNHSIHANIYSSDKVLIRSTRLKPIACNWHNVNIGPMRPVVQIKCKSLGEWPSANTNYIENATLLAFIILATILLKVTILWNLWINCVCKAFM